MTEKIDAALQRKTGLPAEKIREFREIYSLVDVDHNGAISPDELMALTELMNMGATPEEVRQIVSEIDTSGTGNVQFEDFVRALSQVPKVSYSKDDVIQAFSVLAGKNAPADTILMSQLEDALMKYDEGMTLEAAREVSSKAEMRSNRNTINYRELVELMMSESKN